MLQRMKLYLTMLALGGVLLGTAACASAQTPRRVYVRVAPPAERVEVVTVSPGPGHVWVKGYYRWTGRAYVWVPGRWVVVRRGYHTWVPGHWAHDRHGWYWIEGHWR